MKLVVWFGFVRKLNIFLCVYVCIWQTKHSFFTTKQINIEYLLKVIYNIKEIVYSSENKSKIVSIVAGCQLYGWWTQLKERRIPGTPKLQKKVLADKKRFNFPTKQDIKSDSATMPWWKCKIALIKTCFHRRTETGRASEPARTRETER